jgi:hypothetical protein
MSRHIAIAFAAVAVATILVTGAGAGSTSAPGQLAPVNLMPPSISGTTQVGSSLIAAVGRWDGKSLKYAYQWLRCDSGGASCSAIAGTTSSTASLSSADLGATLRVLVTATNRNGSAAATSAATAVVASAPIVGSPPPPPPPSSPIITSPSVTSPPTISGTAQQDQTLTASTGTWSGTTPMTYAYQWQRCDSGGVSCAQVAGATSANYLLASTDIGSTMRVSVSASNSAGSVTASSAATAVVGVAPSEPTGSVLYKSNWEYGVGGLYQGLDPSQWGHQCADNTSTGIRGTYTAVTGDPDSGTYAGRVDLPANTTYVQACEALHSRSVGALGSDDYYAMAVKFPMTWQEPSTAFWGLEFAQLNYEGINSAPLALGAHANNVTLLVNSGACPPPGGSVGCPYWSGTGGLPGRPSSLFPSALYAIPPGQLALGVWHELIIHVHLALDSTGAVEVWRRVKGGAGWTQTVKASGFPTLQTGTTFSGNVITASNISSFGDVDKFGAYRGPSSSPLTIYHDNWCRTSTFPSAASCFG